MYVVLGSDHAGFELKEHIKSYLEDQGHTVKDNGTYSTDRVSYPKFAHSVCRDITAGVSKLGFLFCGSANGVAMAANKHSHIRCAVCWQPEIAKLAREHNDANIAAMPARFVKSDICERMVDIFLNTSFEGGRHEKRVQEIEPVIGA